MLYKVYGYKPKQKTYKKKWEKENENTTNKLNHLKSIFCNDSVNQMVLTNVVFFTMHDSKFNELRNEINSMRIHTLVGALASLYLYVIHITYTVLMVSRLTISSKIHNIE